VKLSNYKNIFLVLLFFPLFAFSKSTQLLSLRFQLIHHCTRIVFALDGNVQYHSSLLTQPDRVVVDLFNTHSGISIKQLYLTNTDIKSVRMSRDGDTVRFVFELKNPVTPKTFMRQMRRTNHYRLTIDLMPFESPQAQPAIQARREEFHDAVIVIDPGHGGKDPGATGVLRTHEKNIVLAIAKDLYADLKQQPHVHPILTREDDHFVPLDNRLELARKARADMFIAIHADAYRTRKAHGASVYALSLRGATSAAASWLADSENSSELMMGGTNLSDQDADVKTVLLNLAQNATIQDSLVFGNYVMQALGKITQLHRHRVEQARFVVLKSPDIPSLLVETGFISNRQEELRLRNVAYRHEIAAALASGIMNYLYQRKSYIAASHANMKYLGTVRHVVRRGESLNEIASHYSVTMSMLRQENHLKTDRLQIGQTLNISQ